MASVSFRSKAALAFGEEFGELSALDLAALNLAGLLVNDVQLEQGLGQIQTNDWQICSRSHGEASRFRWLLGGCRTFQAFA